MKKITLLFFAVVGGFSSSANAFWCNYVDQFHLTTDSDPKLFITLPHASEEIKLVTLSKKGFEIRDSGKCATGTAHLTYKSDPNHWCILVIKDGPSMWHPSIIASCKGVSYKGLDYEGNHSYGIRIL